MTRFRQTLGRAIVCAPLFVTLAACTHKVHTSPPVTVDDSYTDLAAGEHLRIVVPLLKSGPYRLDTKAVRTEGNTIVLSANDLLGYELYRYSVEGHRSGRVSLKLDEAQLSKDGRTAVDAKPPDLPFLLPRHARHLRLIYLVRSSQSDHNMAIASAKSIGALDLFTSRLKANPAICGEGEQVSCYWVPLGIAVRPESP